ncbi:hypothetical protein [Actinomadura sp. 3N407]|uniref:hypothetical protein n=1 Tax=Actinomadura sp. 3N407 TaxID=3457423 RepID=UPI003FCCD4BB
MTGDITWHFNLRHEKAIAAPPELVWRAMFEVRLSDLRLVRALLWARGVPARLTRRQFRASEGLTLFEGAKSRFAVLTNDEPHLFEIGRIAQFWLAVPKDGPLVKDHEAFAAFAEPGYAKALMSFEFRPERGGTRMVTTTRVAATDERARRRFGGYWLMIKLGAGAIRRAMLSAAERRALELAAARS